MEHISHQINLFLLLEAASGKKTRSHYRMKPSKAKAESSISWVRVVEIGQIVVRINRHEFYYSLS